MKLDPVANHPGVFRDPHNSRIYTIRDFQVFETSERVEGTDWQWFRPEPFSPHDTFVLQGWRFSCVEWPKNSVEVQQLVSLKLAGKVESAQSLSSILTCASYPMQKRDKEREKLGDLCLAHNSFVGVQLHDRPVEGAGLRIHLYGLRRPDVTK